MPNDEVATFLIAGIDTGGTFTDTIVVNSQNRKVYLNKVSSTPSDPSVAFMNGLERSKQPLASMERIIHGTTHGTNTLIQRKGITAGLITTKGFRDILEIRRGCRATGHTFDLRWTKRPSLIPRYLRVDIEERLDSEGKVISELREEEVLRAAEFLHKHGVTSVAICFLFSYLNPVHEKRAEQIVKDRFPHMYVSTSSDILPEWREYERFCAAAVNTYILPIMSEYIEHLETKLREEGYSHSLFINSSSGGIMFSNEVKRLPVQTFLSGPAAGVVAAKFLGNRAGFDNLISADMGGTSFDVSIIRGGELMHTTETEVEEGMPLKLSMVDIRTLGAGGGTIAWIDTGGVLKAGPQSAGADPGPVCYGRSGTEPTVTDANLLLGRLNPHYFLGGEQELATEMAEDAIRKRIAGPLGIPPIKAAQGILKVVTATMTRAIRAVTTEKGIDPREFTLMAFGGAGPLHAPLIARELKISHIIVPPYPGLTSALGLLLSDLKFDTVRSLSCKLESDGTDLIAEFLSDLLEQGSSVLRKGGYKEELLALPSVDLRYAGQHFEITVPVDRDNLAVEDVIRRFDEMHNSLYGFNLPGMLHEALRVRMSVVGKVSGKDEILESFSLMNDGEKKGRSVPTAATRKIYEDESESPVEYSVYRRDILRRGDKISSPAIVEEIDSTVYVPTWCKATIDSFGNILVTVTKF